MKFGLLLGLSACCAGTDKQVAYLPDLVSDVRGSVVKVIAYRDNGVMGLGTGYAVSENGHIATAAHVVVGNVLTEVELPSGATYVATVLTYDVIGDVALLRIDAGLNPVKFGNSDKVNIGEPAFAIGHPLGLYYSVSSGVVSSKYRYINLGFTGDFLQLDLATNPGNSGCPVFNYRGELIGMISFSIVSPRGPSGFGMAVPSNRIKAVVDRCIKSPLCN